MRGRRRPHVEEVRTTPPGADRLAAPGGRDGRARAGLDGARAGGDGGRPARPADGGGRRRPGGGGRAARRRGARARVGRRPRAASAAGSSAARCRGAARAAASCPATARIPHAGWQGTVPPTEAREPPQAPGGLLVAGEEAPSRPGAGRVVPPAAHPRAAQRSASWLSAADCLAAQVDVRSLPGLRLQELLRGDEPEVERPRGRTPC